MRKRLLNRDTGITFLIVFLPAFMLLIFGPAEIFFANATEFDFVYGEFAGYLAVLALLLSLAATGVLIFLPEKVRRVLLSLLFGASLAGYLQVLFWNKGLDLLGLNPQGYQARQDRVWWNLVFWLLLFAAVTAFAFWKRHLWEMLVTYSSGFLLCIQLVALAFLMLRADETAYRHSGGWRLSGEEQFTVSSEDNIIVFIIDFFGNPLLEEMREEFPGSTDFLHDFTEYDNADCVYFGTYPSLPHMMTGCELDTSISVNDWMLQIWNNEGTVQFYKDLHDANYKANLYTDDIRVICGTHGARILEDRISNAVVTTEEEIDVFYKLLFKTMIKMSCYRMAPEIIKPRFYTDMSEYVDIIALKSEGVLHENYDFYDVLLNRGLTADAQSNYLIVQHLMGTHECSTDAEGHFTTDNYSRAVTARGCMTILEEYLNQLKALGVYDRATIIVTADHGDVYEVQPVLFVKGPGEAHERSPVNNAPVTHREFLPTLAEYAGLDPTQYGLGRSIHDFAPGEQRERTYWNRNSDPGYKGVPSFDGLKSGGSNVFYGYTYTGGRQEIENIDWDTPDVIMPVVDSFY